MNIQKHKCD